MTVFLVKAAGRWLLLLPCLLGGGPLLRAADPANAPRLENDVLRVELSPPDASITVLDKRINLTWQQKVQPGFHVVPETLRAAAASISCRVSGPCEISNLTIALGDKATPSFDLTVDIPGQHYVHQPVYPFRFMAPEKGWSYVQNTSGEGMLRPMEQSARINKPFSWSGS